MVLTPVTLTVSTWHLKTTIHIEWIVNRRQTTRKMLTKYLNYYFWRVRIFQTVILILQYVLDFGCRILHTGCWRHFQNTTKRRSENRQHLKIIPYKVFFAHVSVVLPQNTTNHDMGTRADPDKSRYEAYWVRSALSINIWYSKCCLTVFTFTFAKRQIQSNIVHRTHSRKFRTQITSAPFLTV